MNKSILVVDKRERAHALAKELRQVIYKPENRVHNIDLLRYNFKHQRYERFDGDDDTWIKIEHPLEVTVRLRHESDNEPLGMPSANMCIRYSGAKDGSSNGMYKDVDYETGLPHGIPSNEGDAEKVFKNQWAEDLIQYVIKGDFPIFLKRPFFDDNLEKQLHKPSFSAAIFAPELFSIIPEATIKTLIIGPEMPNDVDFFRKIDPVLNTYAVNDQMNNGQRSISFSREKSVVKIHPTYLQTESVFNHAAGRGFEQYHLAILTAELQWTDGNFRTYFSGISVAEDLRRRGFRGLIILASQVPAYIVYWMATRGDNFFDLLKSGYSYLWDVSVSQEGGVSLLFNKKNEEAKVEGKEARAKAAEEWEKFLKEQKQELNQFSQKMPSLMSEIYLKEINHYLTPEGKFSTLFHDFQKFVVDQDRECTVHNGRKFLADITPLIDANFATNLDNMQKEFDRMTAQDTLSENDLYQFITKSRNTLEYWLAKSASPDSIVDGYQTEFGVLVLEDDEKTLEEIKKLLDKHQIFYWIARDVTEAIMLLEDDFKGQLKFRNSDWIAPTNFIRVAIVDIRLERPSGRWQLRQGYDFIDYVQSSTSNYVSCIAFTQKERSMMRNAKTTWFPKSILRDITLKELFVLRIKELGEQSWNTAIPDITLFTKGYLKIHEHPFSVYYKQHRMSPDYSYKEQTINQVANNLFDLWKYLKTGEGVINLDKLKANIRATFIRVDLTTGITSAKSKEESERLFVAKMAARRAALAIESWLREHGNSYDTYLEEDFKKEDKKFAIAQICIFLKDFSLGADGADHDDLFQIGLTESVLGHLNREFEYLGSKDQLLKELNTCFEKLERQGFEFNKRLWSQRAGEIDSILLNRHLGLDENLVNWPKLMLPEEQLWLEKIGYKSISIEIKRTGKNNADYKGRLILNGKEICLTKEPFDNCIPFGEYSGIIRSKGDLSWKITLEDSHLQQQTLHLGLFRTENLENRIFLGTSVQDNKGVFQVYEPKKASEDFQKSLSMSLPAFVKLVVWKQ